MKTGGYDRHYKDIVPPVEGLQYHKGQLTKLTRNKSKLGFNCDYCGLPFEKYACWAKRTAHHYCGRACANAAKVVEIPKPCVVCGKEMLLKPSLFKRVSACSPECIRKRRTVNNTNLRASPDYTAIVKKLRQVAVCGGCGTTTGPWIVQGIKLWVEDGLSQADGANARLVCRPCHLKTLNTHSAKSLYMTDRFKYYREKTK